MADFRKFVFVLVAVALFAFTASAQSTPSPAFSCTANASVNTLIRAEGITELLGDVVLNCTGGTPTPAPATGITGAIPQVNLQLTVPQGVNITSRITSLATEALLLLDEPNAPNPNNPSAAPIGYFPCTTVTCAGVGNGTGGFNATGVPNYYGAAANMNTFQGVLVNAQQLVWIGIPIDPPGSNRTRVIRITNIRVNATGYFTAGGTGSFPIGVTLNPTPSYALPIANPVNIAVANVQNGLTFSVTGATSSWRQCFTQPVAAFATLNFKERFLSAFKKRISVDALPYAGYTDINTQPAYPVIPAQAKPGGIYWSESGLMPVDAANVPLGGAYSYVGYASQGTRLKAVFKNIPAGVSVYVDASFVSGNTVARLVSSEAGAFATLGTAGSAVKIADGTVTTATAVWEVIQADPFKLEDVAPQAYLSYTADPGNNMPAVGVTSTVNGSFAPVSTLTTAQDFTVPMPRFADTSTANNLYSVGPCVTNLLFPYVINVVGFDTGMAISNTSTDPWKTSPQAGSCDVYSYGSNAPAMWTTPVVPTATVYTWLTSLQAPNFSGYVIAICRFQYGHGFAFVSDFGAQKLAMGYLALIIPDYTGYSIAGWPAGRAPAPPLNGTLSGENLGQ